MRIGRGLKTTVTPQCGQMYEPGRDIMTSERSFFEIVKERSAKITSALNALELAEQSLEKTKTAAAVRGDGGLIDVRDLALNVITAKKHLDEALAFLIESQLDDQEKVVS